MKTPPNNLKFLQSTFDVPLQFKSASDKCSKHINTKWIAPDQVFEMTSH
jgi:hypothetical protein